MAAPFARRPVITITAGYDSATNTFCGGSTCNVTVSATGPNGASSVSVGSIKIYANGDLVDQVQGNATTLSFSTGLLNPATYSGSIEVQTKSPKGNLMLFSSRYLLWRNMPMVQCPKGGLSTITPPSCRRYPRHPMRHPLLPCFQLLCCSKLLMHGTGTALNKTAVFYLFEV